MSIMIEVFYRAPKDSAREERIADIVEATGGRLTYREDPYGGPSQAICLTFEFSSRDSAEQSVKHLNSLGERVDGPYDYGPHKE
jgi:hypothetical protein